MVSKFEGKVTELQDYTQNRKANQKIMARTLSRASETSVFSDKGSHCHHNAIPLMVANY